MHTYIFRFKNGSGKQVQGNFASYFEAMFYAKELAVKNKVSILFVENTPGNIWDEIDW